MAFNDLPSRALIIGVGVPIEIDAVTSESHVARTTYTDYVIETGGKIQDHAQDEPDMLDMSILLTDTPLFNIPFDGRYRQLYNQLLLWQKLKSPLLITTNLRSYTSMYIEELNATKQSGDGKSVTINLSFKEVDNTGFGTARLIAELLVSPDVIHTVAETTSLGLI